MAGRILFGVVSAFCVLFATAVAAEEAPTPEQQAATATANRQAVFKLLGVSMGPVIGMARGAPFDAAVIRAHITRVSDSCGYAVPRYSYQADRDGLQRWAENKGQQEILAYQAEKNTHSIDGLPALR
ncbi:MAG: cytochrome c [Gammaproteobacteria bacterium]|nr:cytochrome c [Gammaproteobacteria bacterium]